ncbi:MAG: FAD-binding protein, partial [Gammaproteobacteria bacterium]|nr:FAD-binding protein [Gammaproteobacteria bacterium]
MNLLAKGFLIFLLFLISLSSFANEPVKLLSHTQEKEQAAIALRQLANAHNPAAIQAILHEQKAKIRGRIVTLKEAYQLTTDVPTKDGIYYPRNLAELQTLITIAKNDHLQVRVMGAGHSANGSIFNPENSHEIRIILAGDFRKIISIEPDPSNEFAIVKTGAGCYLGVNSADSNSTLENSFNYQIDQAGFALPTLGGISHQTIAGFLQTSSSGGSAHYGIADVIEAIDWIDGNGELHHAVKDEDEFNAVAVSMGLFGVITEVTFKLPKKYLVAGTETNHEFNDSYLVKDAAGHYTQLHNALFVDNDYIHINWLAQKYVNRTMQWMGKNIAY